MLAEDEKKRLADYLGLGLGLLVTAEFRATCTEYDIRNSFSRLYYAFFHVGLAFLLSQSEEIDKYRWDHGALHTALNKRMGKYLGQFVRELYRARREADYEPAFFRKTYNSDIEKARIDAQNLVDRARRNFYWIYNEARKAL